MRLRDGAYIRVWVRSAASGNPVRDATVRLGWVDVTDFHTDENGMALIGPIAHGEWFLQAWAEGCAKQTRRLEIKPSGDAETGFSLAAGATLGGTVRDHANKPVAHARVSAHLGGVTGETWNYVESDSDGRFRIEHVPRRRTLELQVSRSGFLRQEPTVFIADSIARFDILLEPRPHGGSIQGVVVDQQGRQVSGAVLTNRGGASADTVEAKADSGGRFVLENLFANGSIYEVLVQAKGLAPEIFEVTPGSAATPREHRFVLGPGHRIAGRVVDQEGHPLHDTYVYYGNRVHAFGGNTTTDRDGRFTLDSLPADCPFSFRKDGFSPIDNQRLTLDSEEMVTIALGPEGILRGKVVDAPTRRPISSFDVRITFSPKRQPAEPSEGIRSHLIEPGLSYQSPDGKFEIAELLLGMPFQVMVDAEGYERCIEERVVAGAAANAQQVEFKMTALDPAKMTRFSGRLTNAAGAPAMGVEVRLIAAAPDGEPEPVRRWGSWWAMVRDGQFATEANILRFRQAVSDKDGRFEFDNIPRDSLVELFWWGQGTAPGSRTDLGGLTDDDRANIGIIVEPAGRILGSVDRKQFPDAGRVMIRAEGINEIITLKPGQATFELDDLAPGKYVVQLQGKEKKIDRFQGLSTSQTVASREVAVQSGADQQIEFTAPTPEN
ncbi:MAG TPA: carboxypeptidase-like regulatory domain-containing protein [Pirellulales bacterium]